MIDVDELGAAVVTALQGIDDVVAACQGNVSAISYYADQYPTNVNLTRAVYAMAAGQLLLAWKSTGPGPMGGNVVWRHTFTLYAKPAQVDKNQQPITMATLWRAILHGVPKEQSVSFLNFQPAINVDPMDVPLIQRVTNQEGQDMFQADFTYSEIGDD